MSLRIQFKISGAHIGGLAGLSASFTPDPNVVSGNWGVRRVDNSESVVDSGTSLETDGAGRFWHDVTEPVNGLEYEYWVKFTNGTHSWYVNGFVDGTAWWDIDGSWGSCKKWYVDESGRVDRVRDARNNDYTDISCNRIGNAAQRWLSNQFPMSKSEAWLYHTLPANGSMIELEMARYVVGVYELDSEDVDDYGYYPKSELLWWKRICGLAPAHEDDTATTLPLAQNVVFGDDNWATTAIYIEPADEERTILVKAAWYDPTLVLDSDVTFWTYNHPELLVLAMQMIDEQFNRNTQGVNDFRGAIIPALQKIYHNLLEETYNAGPTGRRMIG